MVVVGKEWRTSDRTGAICLRDIWLKEISWVESGGQKLPRKIKLFSFRGGAARETDISGRALREMTFITFVL